MITIDMRHQRFIIPFLLLCVLSLYGQGNDARHSATSAKIVAHRGYWTALGSAQNSLTSLRMASDVGVWGTEFDVRLTSDGVAVLNHDASVFGVRIEDVAYDRLRRLRLLNGECLPTLDSYLRAARKLKTDMRLVLEIKPHGSVMNEDRCVDEVLRLVGKYGLQSRTDYISFSLHVCERVVQLASQSRVFYLGGDVLPRLVKRKGISGISYSQNVFAKHPEWIDDAHRLSLFVNVWTVDDMDAVKRFAEEGLDFITTNRPVEALRVLDGNNVSLEPKPLKVITYNIRNSRAAKIDGDNCWNNRREGTLNMFREECPDLIGVQEALSDQVEYLRTHCPEYGYIGVGRDDGKEKGESMGIFYNPSRLRLLRSDTYWLSATPDSVSYGWDAVCRRTVTCSLFEDLLSGRRMAYLNTHLDHKGEEARRESVLLLCRLLSEWVPSGVAVILGGDMNSAADDVIFEPLLEAGFQESRKLTPLADTRDTFNGWGKGSGVIDHFFIKGFNVINVQRLDGDYGVPYLSDHYPVVMSVR